MSAAADLVAKLAAAGTPPELLAAVAQQLFLGEADRSALAERRKNERDRKARSREVTGQSGTGGDANGAPPNDIYSNPPDSPVEAKASTAPRGRSDRGSKIPVDWEAPSIADLSPEAQALAKQWPAGAYRAEAEAFRNYWIGEAGAKARKSNWNSTWGNRIVAVHGKVMRQAKFAEVPNTVGKGNRGPMSAADIRRAIAFAEEQNDFDRIAELTGQLEKLSARPPPGPVGDIIGRIGVRVGHG